MALVAAVQDPGQRRSLSASGWHALVQDEHQHQVTLGGEVSDVLGDHGPAFGPGGRRRLYIVGGAQAGLADVDGITAGPGAKQLGGGDWEHLVDQEGGHARRAARCRAVWRLRSAVARLRSIRSRIWAECSAA